MAEWQNEKECMTKQPKEDRFSGLKDSEKY